MDEKKIGVIHYNFPGYSFEEFLRYASETGFGYVELSIADVWKPDVSDLKAEAEKVRQIVERYGLKVSALSAGNDFVLLDEDEIAKQVERMRKICEVARTLGTKVIRTEGGRPKDSVPQERWDEAIAGCLRRCLDFAEELDVYFALDNHGLVTNDAELQVRIFESVGSKRVGSNLDTMNYRWFGHDLKTINHFYEIIAPYVLHTHMKDGTGSRGEYRGAALGEGEIDLHYAVKCLKEAGYDGVWCAEYEGREDPAIGYRKCYQWLVENV